MAKKEVEATVAKAEKGPMDLTEVEARTLTALDKAGQKGLTRGELATKTDIKKGWARILGAASKEDGGGNWDKSLEGRGLVKQAVNEESRAMTITITALGKKALAKHGK